MPHLIVKDIFMPIMELLFRLVNFNTFRPSKEENFLLEAELFIGICTELKEIFRKQESNYFNLMKFSREEEDTMLDAKFVRLIINDILSTNEYNLQGIACYAKTYLEVVEEIIIGRNTNPSAALLQRLIELHQSVRRELYNKIIKKHLSMILAKMVKVE